MAGSLIKTKEMTMDYRKRRTEHTPILIYGAIVEQVESSLVSTSPINYHGPNTPRQL